MRDIVEIEAACERAAENQVAAQQDGSQYRGMSYEDGIREALDWVCENQDEDPTNQ